MQSFTDAFNVLLDPQHEGKTYVNNPHDPGGETMYGVTKRVAIRNGYTGDMRNLPLATAMQIAKSEYWDKCQCDKLDPNLAFQVFDCAYNHGVPNAVRFLQQAVGATPDGVMGPLTLAAVNALPWWKVAFRVLGIRQEFFCGLDSWASFGRGWSRRVAANNKIAGS